MENRPRVLFTTPTLRHPAAGGQFLRIENCIKALSQISELYIYSRVALRTKAEQAFYEGFCREFYFAPSVTRFNGAIRLSRRAANYLARRMLKRSFSTEDSEGHFEDLLNVAQAISADVIWLGYGNISYPLLRYVKGNSDFKVVLDTDSVWSRHNARVLPHVADEAEYGIIKKAVESKEIEERWGTQLADVTTAVSEVDAAYYRSLAKFPEQVHLFSNVVDVDSYTMVPAPPKDLKKPCVYLAGSFGPQGTMYDAARWLILEILPLVRRRFPGIHLYIVGSGSRETLSDIYDPNITITGGLPSVLPYLCHAAVALVPLRSGSGTRFKILEAGACGVPVVSTTLGAEGLSVVHGQDILIADDPQSFADSVIKMIADPDFAMTTAHNLRRLVHDRYSIPSLVREGRLILSYLT